MTTRTIHFYECEHGGDLDHYVDDVLKAGATILDSAVDADAESGWIRVSTSNWDAFVAAFSDSDAFGFSSLA